MRISKYGVELGMNKGENTVESTHCLDRINVLNHFGRLALIALFVAGCEVSNDSELCSKQYDVLMPNGSTTERIIISPGCPRRLTVYYNAENGSMVPGPLPESEQVVYQPLNARQK